MHVIRLVHPCGTVVVLRTGGRRIGGETVSEGSYHDAATGDLTTHCAGCGEYLGSAFVGAKVIIEPSPHTTSRCGRRAG